MTYLSGNDKWLKVRHGKEAWKHQQETSAINDYLKTNIVDQVNESVMSIRDTIINALKEDNAQLRNKVELLEKTLLEVEISRNNLEQYTRRNILKFRAFLQKSLMKN